MYMKRTTFIAICLVLVSLVNAQDYRPLVKDGRTWNSYWTNGYYEVRVEESICGDSIIDGEKWYKLYTMMKEWNTDTVVSKQGLKGFLREQDRQVFYLNRNGSKQLLYDFNLNTGDTWSEISDRYETERIIVSGIDMISSEGITYRRFKLNAILEMNADEPLYHYDDGYWTEGIGCCKGLLNTTGWFIPGGTTKLLSCYDGDICIFKADAIDDSGTASIDKPIQHGNVKPCVIHDLQGRRLTGKPTKGVYIQNGRKVVVR